MNGKPGPFCGVRANDHASEPCSRTAAFRKSIRRPPGNVKENRRRSGICGLSDAPSTAQATCQRLLRYRLLQPHGLYFDVERV